MATRMQQRRGTAAQWISTNSGNGPILNAGEIGFETDTNRFKIGDGTNHWINLDYFVDSNSTVNPSFGSSITFEGATADAYETTLQVTDPTADRTITFPDATGTVALTSDISELSQDAIDAALTAGTGITKTYNDGANTITLAVDTTTIQSRVSGVSDTEIGYLDGVTSAIQTQINSKLASSTAASTYAPIASPTFTGTVSGVTKAMVGLGNVDNTSDANKPVSTATQTALDLKANIAGPTFTGTVVLPSTTSIGNVSSTEIGYLDGVTSAIQTQLDNKQSKVTGVSDTELGYLDGVTSAIQTQINTKAPTASPTFTGNPTFYSVTATGLTGTGKMVLDTSPSITTPKIDTINSNSSGYNVTLWSNIGSGNVGISGGQSTGNTSIANGTSFTGTLNLASGITTTGTKTVNIGTNSTGGTTNVTIGSSSGATSNVTLNGTITLPSTTSIGAVSSTELGYLDGVTSAIQTQLDAKLATATAASTYAPIANPTFTGTVTIPDSAVLGTPASATLTNATGLPLTGLVASTSEAIAVGTIKLGHATDTILSRSSAGVLSVANAVVPTVSSVNTLTNKSLSASTTHFVDATDSTKKLAITTSGNTTDVTGVLAAAFTTAKTLTLPDATDTLVGKTTTDTLTNKTLTSPVINGGTMTSSVFVGAMEKTVASATAATGTINFDAKTQSVLYYTSNSSANWTLNIRGDSSTALNAVMATNDAMTVVFMATNGTTAYYPTALQIDGTSINPKYQGGTAWSSGNASSVDAYTYTIIKTGNNTFTVLASQTKFA